MLTPLSLIIAQHPGGATRIRERRRALGLGQCHARMWFLSPAEVRRLERELAPRKRGPKPKPRGTGID